MPTQTPQQQQNAFQDAGVNASQAAGVKAGVGYTPAPLTAGNLTPQTPMQVPTPPASSAAALAGIQTSGNAILDSLAKLKAEQAQSSTSATAPSDLSALLTQYLGSAAPPPSASDTYDTLNAASGIDARQNDANVKAATLKDAQSKLAATNAALAGINARAQSIPLQDQQNATGRGVTAAGLAPITSAELRNNALEAIPLQAQAIAQQAAVASAQGDATLAESLVSQAQNHLDKVFQIHMQDATNQYTYQNDLRKMVYDYATTAEKTILDNQQKSAEQAHTDQQDALKNAQELAKTAITNGQADVAAKIAALDPTSATYRTDLANLEGQIQAKPVTPKIIGTGKTGYYTVDANGELKPLGIGGGSGAGNTTDAVPPHEVSQGHAALVASKYQGTEADGKYADPNLYLKYYTAWKNSGGDPAVFFKSFPPATYINPANTSLPKEIMQFVKKSGSTFQ